MLLTPVQAGRHHPRPGNRVYASHIHVVSVIREKPPSLGTGTLAGVTQVRGSSPQPRGCAPPPGPLHAHTRHGERDRSPSHSLLPATSRACSSSCKSSPRRPWTRTAPACLSRRSRSEPRRHPAPSDLTLWRQDGEPADLHAVQRPRELRQMRSKPSGRTAMVSSQTSDNGGGAGSRGRGHCAPSGG